MSHLQLKVSPFPSYWNSVVPALNKLVKQTLFASTSYIDLFTLFLPSEAPLPILLAQRGQPPNPPPGPGFLFSYALLSIRM